ncbi:flagellar hook-associated protein 1 FlgK [Clostridium algifaecis]|uniref:Flagellar hook-associated protein 1 n=1 Tax=Clostridium algifaecis TaxID=1472040 RepID=A0ABS4KY57_9CLOT|nr:flagellar hook-associated protein FlgK [Clostridium algifaecis]MBP2033819.1 flagellar hook-associated protein 1 FlgK [Clostridium algifaecis]
MPGLFSIFNTAKSGLFSQQTAIEVTSHNISNANTDGYSRQRADMVTTTPYTMPSMDNAASAGQLGTGVTIDSIERIRDTFLDYQYRVSNGVSGQFTARDKYLSQVESALNEPSDTGISKLMTNLFTSWQNLSTSSQNSSTVAQQAYQLTGALNNTYSQLTSIKDNTASEIKTTVVDANSLLERISELNKQIRDIKISGQNPNDLMDSRDLLLDKLSNDFGIDVTQKSYDGIDVTTTKSSTYGDAGDNGAAPLLNGKALNIVQSTNPDDTNVATFSYVNSITRSVGSDGKPIDPTKDTNGNTIYQYDVTYYKKGNTLTDDNKVTIKVNMTEDQEKQLDKYRVLWSNSSGMAYKAAGAGSPQTIDTGDSTIKNGDTVDFDQLTLFKPATGKLKGYMTVQDDVSDYQDKLNKLAKSLALSVNAIISQSSTWVADNVTDGSAEGGINNFFVNSKPADSSSYTATDENNITAANITVNVKILDKPSLIKTDTKYDSNGNSLSTNTDGNRALAVAKLADALMDIQDVSDSSTRSDLVGGTFSTDSSINNVYAIGNKDGGATISNYFTKMINRVGLDEEESSSQVTNTASQLSLLNQSKASDSGVSIDEEMTNLIQFQHCYQANAKMISTVDDLLDVVINGLKKS